MKNLEAYYKLRGLKVMIEQNTCVGLINFLLHEVYRNFLEIQLKVSFIYAGTVVRIPNNYPKRHCALLNRSRDWSKKFSFFIMLLKKCVPYSVNVIF